MKYNKIEKRNSCENRKKRKFTKRKKRNKEKFETENLPPPFCTNSYMSL